MKCLICHHELIHSSKFYKDTIIKDNTNDMICIIHGTIEQQKMQI